ncbi:MAG: NAD(P)-binding domain-containing protein [Leptospira sp.]|nr:NAD(P)-binding domain-containing protein [Leptospira sp.]
MIPEFHLFHDIRKERPKDELPNLFTWNTCQRTLRFSFKDLSENHSEDIGEHITGIHAFALLLEIVCGLHSRLFCETEILSQFLDRFKDSKFEENSDKEKILYLRDLTSKFVSVIREKHINPILLTSYGQLLKKYISINNKITIFGTGNLTESLIFDLQKLTNNIRIIGRNPTALKNLNKKYEVTTHRLEEELEESDVYIIATPTFSEDKLKSLIHQTLVIDFREESEPHFFKTENYLTIHDLLKNQELTAKEMEDLRYKLSLKITEEVKSFALASSMFDVSSKV